MTRFRFCAGLGVCLLAVSLFFHGTPETGPSQAQAWQGQAANALARVMQIPDRNAARLMQNKDVVGTATGVSRGRAVIKVYTVRAGVAGIPRNVEGVPVVIEVTSRFFAKPRGGNGGGNGGNGGGKPPKDPPADEVDPKSKFALPVPIGVSIGNENSCSAGTISCRLNGGTLLLSNNHVIALENAAPIGGDPDNILQPGLFNTNCKSATNTAIGVFFDHVEIEFSTSASNTVDAAIATTDAILVDDATPADGYGKPKSTIIAPSLSMNVQKYGRTTNLTTGQISGINATVNIGYSNGTARFVNQIIVSGNGGRIYQGRGFRFVVGREWRRG